MKNFILVISILFLVFACSGTSDKQYFDQAGNLVKEKNLNAGNIIRDLAKEINGGGGGQPFYAQAGGSKLEGLGSAISKAKTLF